MINKMNMYYDWITSKDFSNDDYNIMLNKYKRQERGFRTRFSNYIDNMTLKYEEINHKQPVKKYKIPRENDDNV